jgi:hypothetical protein
MNARTSGGGRAPDKTDANQFHVGVWSCVSCSQKVVLVYPEKLSARATKAWPIGSSRKIEDSRLPPGSIPDNIIKDFREAALIEELSPAASATLSRRCLQSILQHRFADLVGKYTKLKRQVQEVLDAKELPPYIADELHGIRSIGNSGAHANVDPATNEIVEIEGGEAAACLDVIQELVRFLYVEPHLTKERKAAREKKFGPDAK